MFTDVILLITASLDKIMASLGSQTDPTQNSLGAFKCYFPGCNASYRRKEHLHRHEAKHFQLQDFSCTNCGRGFGRSDTLRRHVRQHHKIIAPPKRSQRACENCHAGKSRCEGGVPCYGCRRRRIQCSLDDSAGSAENQFPRSATHRASNTMPRLQNFEKAEQCISLYFEVFHPYWSFIHKGTFNVQHEMPLLVQSIVVIGLWASGGESAQSAAVELHGKLDLAIRDQKEKWDVSEVDGACSPGFWPIASYQAILLHIVFSLVISSPGAIEFDLKISLPPGDLGLLYALVGSCRKRGMFAYPNILAQYQEANLASFVWVSVEEIKRFNIALYKVCRKASSSNVTDGNQRGTSAVRSLLTASELQFPLPENCPLWNATSKDEWTALMKDEKFVSLYDDCQEKWISNFAQVLEFFEI
ncbi:uncharacterized protein N7482_010557 [Penicillium canariense]|uniref:Uncharacterized protein n=1 Tax=Penicillium canariense TaxID=189055 RepID=A0A9W9HM29_9EURO|nr:uncharacterized protein N7482_010557 [Penicillium canariense]KAJ5151305.1 hypothetical protein N7482_010557 [Penicillium canariense]